MEGFKGRICKKLEKSGSAKWIGRWHTEGLEICGDHVLRFAPSITKKVCINYLNINKYTFHEIVRMSNFFFYIAQEAICQDMMRKGRGPLSQTGLRIGPAPLVFHFNSSVGLHLRLHQPQHCLPLGPVAPGTEIFQDRLLQRRPPGKPEEAKDPQTQELGTG